MGCVWMSASPDVFTLLPSADYTEYLILILQLVLVGIWVILSKKKDVSVDGERETSFDQQELLVVSLTVKVCSPEAAAPSIASSYPHCLSLCPLVLEVRRCTFSCAVNTRSTFNFISH